MVGEAQKKATQKYKAANTVNFSFNLNRKYDEDIITRLKSVENKTGYIKELIRNDIGQSE